MSAASTEVLIAGGGVVGAALALLLAGQARIAPQRIVVLEPKPVAPPLPGSPPQLRVSAISPGNRERLLRLGAWQRMDATRIASIQHMAVWHHAVPPDSPDVLRFDAAESGARELGVIVENAALQGALLAACAQAGITVHTTGLRALRIDAAAAHAVLDSGAELDAELIVGADGAVSAVRKLLHLAADSQGYGQRALVATVRPQRPHGATAYQRFLNTGPLALLPLPEDRCSIVWSATDAHATALLALPADAFNTELTAASAGVLGRLVLEGERAGFPLQRLAAQRYVAPRAALVGDAAHVIHPLAGQGVNQGLEDAAVLAAQLARRPPRESVGALAALRAYERERRAGNALVGGVVHGLDRLFTDVGPVTSLAARTGLALVARSALARRFLVRQAATDRSSPRR